MQINIYKNGLSILSISTKNIGMKLHACVLPDTTCWCSISWTKFVATSFVKHLFKVNIHLLQIKHILNLLVTCLPLSKSTLMHSKVECLRNQGNLGCLGISIVSLLSAYIKFVENLFPPLINKSVLSNINVIWIKNFAY